MRKMVSARIDEDTDRALEKLAFEAQRPKAELLERAIRLLLDRAKKAGEKRLEGLLR